MTNQELQQKYLEYQLIARQLNMLNQQLELINNKINELNVLVQSMDEINSLKKEHEILVPVGPGILVNASIKNTNDVLMNIGANIVVKKSVANSKEIIEMQIKELKQALDQTEKEIIDLNTEIDSIKKDLSTSNE
ncbi:prefoldin subunit alpha [Candidatus Woesearchaeota archaeon]|nr:prefoldin subunit alpha [Candidatus Woesearchaeota archaeon]